MEMEKSPESVVRPLSRLKLKNRQGFQEKGMRFLYRVLRPFFHCRVHIPRELRESEEPIVFIANHYNVFGPLSFVVSVPLNYRIWINSELVDEEEARKGLEPGVKRLLPFLSDRASNWVSGKLLKLVMYALTHVGMIPVDRKDASKLLSTMRQSIAALQEGQNLLIFPETGFPEYSLTSVTPFFSGFATLGRLYHRRTGKALRFCPCYIDEQHYQIRLGEMVTYDPDAEPNEETERVSEELNRRIREMAAENRGVEKEKSTPVRTTILFFCNLLRTLLLIPLITMLSLPNPNMILLFYGISEAIRILFNAVCSVSYASTNRMPFLYSHGVGILTDLSMMIYLTALRPSLRWLLIAVIINGIVILTSNIWARLKFHRCAGINYFDTLSANLLFVVCLQQMLHIHLQGWILGALVLGTMICLGFSGAFAVAFNGRIGMEEQQEETADSASP